MSSKHLTMNLTRNINRFLLINLFLLLSLIVSVLAFTGYENRELLVLILLSGASLIGVNYMTGKIMKRKMEKIIQNSLEKIETQLYYDELTQVYNRKTGIIRLNEEIARAKRTGAPLVVAILDIDNFKNINDTYGHLVGDRALNHVATQIKQALRACDIVMRYGGEEFVVILPNTDEISGFVALERVRERISKKPVKVGNQTIKLTVSIGLREIAHDEDAMTAIEKADLALYQAKRSGKNRVEVFLNYAGKLN